MKRNGLSLVQIFRMALPTKTSTFRIGIPVFLFQELGATTGPSSDVDYRCRGFKIEKVKNLFAIMQRHMSSFRRLCIKPRGSLLVRLGH